MSNESSSSEAQDPNKTTIDLKEGGSPLHPANLANLFFRPTRFFTDDLELGTRTHLVNVGWIYGIVKAINQIDKELFRADLGSPRISQSLFFRSITESWVSFWLWILVSGAIGGIFYWWISGWWFRKRAEWSSNQIIDSREARIVFLYSTAILALPIFIIQLVRVVAFPNYGLAYADEGIIGWVITVLAFILPFWALVVGYKGAKASFEVSTGKGIFWFLILPGVFYLGGYLILFIGMLFI